MTNLNLTGISRQFSSKEVSKILWEKMISDMGLDYSKLIHPISFAIEKVQTIDMKHDTVFTITITNPNPNLSEDNLKKEI